jgi:hypothetical protein
MIFEMQKSLMLSENIHSFIKFVNKSFEEKNPVRIHPDKLFQVKLLIEEYKFQLLADELHRINQFEWDGKYSYLLIDEIKSGLQVITEYIQNNYDDLFFLTARLYTLNNLCSSLNRG